MLERNCYHCYRSKDFKSKKKIIQRRMSACNIDVVKRIGKYLNISVGPLCYNSDKTLTTVLNKENIEGFATIILRLAELSSNTMTQEQKLQCYQWLEHLSMHADQALVNLSFSKNFLEGLSQALEENSYLTGQSLTIADVAVYHVIYPLLDRLTVVEREGVVPLCRWARHVQSDPAVCAGREPLALDALLISAIEPNRH